MSVELGPWGKEVVSVSSQLLRGESGQVEIAEEWIARGTQENPYLMQELDRVLLRSAHQHKLQVLIARDLLRNVWVIKWEPAGDPRFIGVWKLA